MSSIYLISLVGVDWIFLLMNDKQPVFLEINTVPGMTSHSLVPMAAKEIGINFDDLCLEILRTSTD